MDLISSLSKKGNIRGITLNSQQLDLFNLIEKAKIEIAKAKSEIEKAKIEEEAIQSINEYLEGILEAHQFSKENHLQRLNKTQKIKKVVDEKATHVPNTEEFYEFLLSNSIQIASNWDSREKLEELFKGQEIDSTYIDEILNLKKFFAYETHGILTFLVDKDGNTINPERKEIVIDRVKTYQKVEALYNYIIGNLENEENRFTRLTLDGQGKFGTVAGLMPIKKEAEAKPEDYNLDKLRQGYEFAHAHKMNEVYVNALVFFKDFPERLVGGTEKQYEIALINYGKAVASIVKEYEAQGIHTVVDMFNEFVDYYAPFSERTNAWMSKLSVEDLCKIALTIKQEMPNADLGYNDWNFENPEKRKVIFEVIRKIQAFEAENDCKIIDHIGTQCHTSINDIAGLRESIEELQQFGLPIDITELDISKGLAGVDYKTATPEELAAIRKYEQKLQNEVMKMISDFVKEGKIRAVTSWSITDELCCDFCDGKEASITGMIYDSQNGFSFSGKDMDEVIEMTLPEMQLIAEHRARVRKNSNEEINQNPTQDFCFHTHTERCGHGAKDTGDEEWVQNAIKGGIKKLAFTDHIPLPDGYNKTPDTRMDIAEVDSYLASIRYLQEKYEGQIEIESGFEFEYSDRDLEHLQKLKSKTDKMILGQHFVIDSEGKKHEIARGKNGEQISDTVLEMYGKAIVSAMDKDKKVMPDVIAHPDLFMQARDNFGEEEKSVTRAICDEAIKNGIPLEINFGKIASKLDTRMSIEEIAKRTTYPSPEFWKFIAEEYGKSITVIYGKDAHYPGQLSTERDYEIAKAIIGEETLQQLHIVTSHKKLEGITLQELGEGTTKEFTANPAKASKAYEDFKNGVAQAQMKEGQTQGEE